MKKIHLQIISVVVLFILILTIPVLAQNPTEISLTIKKIDGVWKVVDSTDYSKKQIKAKRNQKIVWTAEGTDVYFQFMDEGLVGKYKSELKAGKKMKMKIGENAKMGSNPYAVFCLKDKEFAIGNSPPTIIIIE